jgi:hypothetical protein
VGSIDGVTPQVLAYRVAAGDLLTTLGTGDGTYERIDGIFIKIADDVAGDSQSRDFEDAVTRELSSQTTNVKFRTSIVKSVVPGTPSATPVKPATPSGYVPWCYVRVRSTYASTFDPTHISDWRVPMRVGAVDVMAREMIPDSGISLSADTAYFDMGAAANVAVNAIFPFGPDCRLLAAELHGDFNISHGTSDGEIDMVPSRLNLDVFPYTTGGGLSGNSDALWADFGSHVNSIFHSMMDRNVAFWGNGYAAGMAANQGGQEGGKKLELNVIYQQSAGSAQTAKLSFVRFYYAY